MTLSKYNIFILLAIMSLVSCSSDKIIEEQEQPMSTDPMRFGVPSVGDIVQTKTVTRATAEELKSGFLVSAYKNRGTGSQQTVMNQYEAIYKQDDWYQNSQWGTVGTTADGFYQNQLEKYWDYSAFPYEFFAIAPCPTTRDKVIDGFGVTDTNLKIKSHFNHQTVDDGTVTASPFTGDNKEYLVSQVKRSRNTSSSDKTDDVDMLTGRTITSGGTPSGAVKLPFHHLTSKVRFAIYTTEHVDPKLTLPIKNVTVKATSADGFATGYEGYESTYSAGKTMFDNGQFTGITRKQPSEAITLLKFSGPTADKFTDAYLEKHEWKSTTDLNAYYFECEDGLLQMPQKDVKLTVSLEITGWGDEDKFTDVPLKIIKSDGNEDDLFTWRPNCLYTYYIVISRLYPHGITFTATVAPWEDVEGNLSTNLEE